MLTIEQYTTAVFTAYRANAVLVESLRTKEALGCYPNWGLASQQNLKIQSGLWTLEAEDFDSDGAIDIYNQLLEIGSTWFGGIAFDPNAQNPIIEVVNVLSQPAPIDPINWSDLDPATQDPNGNRDTYLNDQWAGWNPVLSLTSPAETALRLGIDYQLIPAGGIQFLVDFSGAGSLGISDGQTLRASSYIKV